MKIFEAKKENEDIIFNLFSELMDVHVYFAPTLFKPAVKDELFNKFINEALDNDNQKIFIEYLDDLPVGYIHIFIDRLKKNIYSHAKNIIHIEQLIVTERYRGNGYGKALINYVIEYAKNLNINRIEVNTLTFNKKTKKFYDKIGFNNFIEKMYININKDA